VEAPERLSFGEEISSSPLIRSGETTVEFIELGEERTKILVSSRLICADELVAMAQAGWTSQLHKLERLLAAPEWTPSRPDPSDGSR
jgi:hypothetical protein